MGSASKNRPHVDYPICTDKRQIGLQSKTGLIRALATGAAFLFGHGHTHALAVEFEPVRVADQPRISMDMLDAELEQFVQYGKAIQASFNAPQLQRNVAQAETDLRRAEELYKSNSVSYEELRSKQNALAQARKSIEINLAGQNTAVARAEVAKYKILEQGQPGLSSYILPAAKSQLDYLLSLQALLARAKEKAENEFTLATFLEENGRKLVEQGAFPREELERRILARQRAQTGVQTAQAELDALTPAVEAARRTLTKVQGG